MRQFCKFRPEHDLQEHVPNLHTDIAKAIASGGVVAGSVPTEFNLMDIEHAENGVRLREPFDALEYEASLKVAQTSFSSGTGNLITPMSTQTE